MQPVLSPRKLRQMLGIDIDAIRLIANTAPDYYKPFDLYKGKRSDGTDKWRHIDNPSGDLKKLQTLVLNNVLKPYALALPDYMTGGLPKRSIRNNAQPHLGQEVVVGLDVVSCFPSIKHKMVFRVFREQLGFSDEVASILTKISTYQSRLPQGAPTSPVLCNLVMQPIADQIAIMASEVGSNFTIYVDDVTLSGSNQSTLGLVGNVIKLFKANNLSISSEKKSIMTRSQLQKVTGLKVNSGATISKERYEDIRGRIMAAGKTRYATSRDEQNRIWGLVHFVKSVDSKSGARLVKLANDNLVDVITYSGTKKEDVRRDCKNYRRAH